MGTEQKKLDERWALERITGLTQYSEGDYVPPDQEIVTGMISGGINYDGESEKNDWTAGHASLYPQSGRAAICTNGDSDWGDYFIDEDKDSVVIRLDNGQTLLVSNARVAEIESEA